MQGVSDTPADPDHHVRLLVNGFPVGDDSWDGRAARSLEADLPPGVLHEGDNVLAVENVGDTAASNSMVLLDRFSLRYPRLLLSEAGSFEAGFTLTGTAEVAGLGPPALLVDLTDPVPRWLTGAEGSPIGLAFRVEPGHRCLAIRTPLAPEVRKPLASDLRDEANRADYLAIGPRELLDAAQGLLQARRDQGLATRAVAIEEVFQEFGYGEATPQAVKDFIAYAYHHWQAPSPRYVLLLGDATYDPKDYLKTGAKNQVPPFTLKTTYLWTASDPAYAAVNGDDLLPDLALGRLPARSVAEATTLVDKILAWESSGQSLDGRAVLVADDPDIAGDFEADADQIAATELAGRAVGKIYYSQLLGGTRPAIVSAFDRGASLLSYLGHGGINLWATENLFNNLDVASLAPQPEQPLLMTMNCLNGYFHFPSLNSLSEEIVKAEGRGAVAAFSPSGLSLDGPAHLYHRALLRQIASGTHDRLGDALLAAQQDYASTGALPELLDLYLLLGDPALKLR
jgi:Peptidase family C25